MRVLIVSGIYPPDVGGPATHGAEVAAELTRRGYAVHIVSFTDETHPVRVATVTRFPRRWHWVRRQLALARWIVANRRSFDVVYTTGVQSVAIVIARLLGLGVVAKVVGDPAWERSRRLGLTSMSAAEFQARRRGGPRVRAMRWVRTRAIRAANQLVVPSNYLYELVTAIAGPGRPVAVIPNGVARPSALPGRHAGSADHLQAIYVGRLLPLKNVDVLIRAAAATPGVTLDVLGDGPDADALAALLRDLGCAASVTLSGAVSHQCVLERIAASDVLCLASDVEGFPHVILEALACGVPAVSTAVGGVPELIADGENGLYVDRSSVNAFARVFAELRDSAELRERLRSGAERSGRNFRIEACVDRLEPVLRSAGPSRQASASS